MRAIRKFGSMRGVWKRSQGRATKAPPDEYEAEDGDLDGICSGTVVCFRFPLALKWTATWTAYVRERWCASGSRLP